jgi:UDP-N-acetyl-D-mannosaminuronic acid dehydrogenase
VSFFEPFKPDYEIPGARRSDSLENAASDADVVVLLVGHTQFKSLAPDRLAAMTRSRILVDLVNGWNAESFITAGFKVFRLGVGRE